MIKKFYFTILVFGLSLLVGNGQNFSKEFGVISNNEIELKEYCYDKGAEAVVLFDIGKSYFARFKNSFDIIFERSTRIKILSEAGKKMGRNRNSILSGGGCL